MIYLNNAATGYPKPFQVIKAVNNCIRKLPAGQFRNNSGGQLQNISIENKCRNNLARLFNIKEPERIFFTSGATESLNLVINGLECENQSVITTVTEHNSMLRPLFSRFAPKGIKNSKNITIINCDEKGKISVSDIEKNIKPDTFALFLNHCSNVTGTIQPLEKIGKLTKEKGILFIVDASQSAGHIKIDAEKSNIDILIFTGHKGLMGISGTGGFYAKKGIPLHPVKTGGTGKDSEISELPEDYQEYEAGTLNISGITALNCGVESILRTGIDKIANKESNLTNMLLYGLKKADKIKIYAREETTRAPVVSFNIEGLKTADVGYILAAQDIIVRTGLMCAPLMHRALGTFPEGAVRASMSYFTTEKEIVKFIQLISEINNSI